jgi:hypothetical protein
MSARDRNPRNYEIVVNEINGRVGNGIAPCVQITIPGKLSAKTRREILEAIKDGHVDIVSKVIA